MPYLVREPSKASHLITFRVCFPKFDCGHSCETGALIDHTEKDVPDTVDTVRIYEPKSQSEWVILSDKLMQYTNRNRPKKRVPVPGEDESPL